MVGRARQGEGECKVDRAPARGGAGVPVLNVLNQCFCSLKQAYKGRFLDEANSKSSADEPRRRSVAQRRGRGQGGQGSGMGAGAPYSTHMRLAKIGGVVGFKFFLRADPAFLPWEGRAEMSPGSMAACSGW